MNGPNSIVLSGMIHVVEKVLKKLGTEGIYLQVSHAFHSLLMNDMEEDFSCYASSFSIQQPLTIPLASTVSGKVLPNGETIYLDHWVKQLASPVLFEKVFVAAMDNGVGDVKVGPGVVVEVGPKPIISRMGKSWWNPEVGQEVPLWAVSLDIGNSLKIREATDTVTIRIKRDSDSDKKLIGVSLGKRPTPSSPTAFNFFGIRARGVEDHTVFHET